MALFGRGWPRLGTGELLTVLVRLPGRLSDPAAAWPRAARADLPRPRRVLLRAGNPRRRGRRRRHNRLAVFARSGVFALLRGGGGGARWAAGADLRVLYGRGRGGSLGLRAIERAARARAGPRAPALRRATTCVGRVRPAAVGQVRRPGGPGPTGMGRPRRRLLDQDRPAGVRRCTGVGDLEPCSSLTRSLSPARRRAPGRRCTGRGPGTARWRSRGGWRPRARLTSAASRAGTSGRSPPSNGWRPCCSRPQEPAPASTAWCGGPTGRDRASSTRGSRG